MIGMRMMRAGMMLAAVAVMAACSGKPSLEDASLSTRELELEEFFDGRLVAYGQFQDIFGTVRRQFVVNIQGDWDGKRLRLVEDFVYEDGSTEQRVWTLVKTGRGDVAGDGPRCDRGGHGGGEGRPVQLEIHDRPARAIGRGASGDAARDL